MDNYFEELFNVNVSDKIEKKNGLSYVSWAVAWGEVKKRHPTALYTIYENEQGWNYFTDGKTAWVKTSVSITLFDKELQRETTIEHIEYLPVMDFKNKSIPVDQITSMDVNKSIQRSLTKACARHGLGLYVYAGEDLPEEEQKMAVTPISDKDIQILKEICKKKGKDPKKVFNVPLEELTVEQFQKAKLELVKLPDKE